MDVQRFDRRKMLGLMGLASAGAVLGACSSSPSSSGKTTSSGSSAPKPTVPSFPLGAAAKASGVVSITMWHSMGGNNLTTLQSLVAGFNRSQSKISVSLKSQNSYTDTFTAYRAGLASPSVLPAPPVRRSAA